MGYADFESAAQRLSPTLPITRRKELMHQADEWHQEH
jgi:hypothetical protein